MAQNPWFRVENLTRPLARPLRVQACQTFFCRLRGLMARPTLPVEQGLLFLWPRPTRWGAAVHMFFMRFPLALVWLDAQDTVVDVRPAYPWRTIAVPKAPATRLLELALARLPEFQPGDRVRLVEDARASTVRPG